MPIGAIASQRAFKPFLAQNRDITRLSQHPLILAIRPAPYLYSGWCREDVTNTEDREQNFYFEAFFEIVF